MPDRNDRSYGERRKPTKTKRKKQERTAPSFAEALGLSNGVGLNSMQGDGETGSISGAAMIRELARNAANSGAGRPTGSFGSSNVRRSLADAMERIRTGRSTAGTGRLGGVLGGLGGALGDLAGTSARAPFDVNNLANYLVDQQAPPPMAPQFSPNLVDVDAALAHFGGARENVQSQYDQNLARLAELAAQGEAQAAAQGQITQDFLGAQGQNLDAANLQARQALQSTAQMGMTDLNAQGVDPSVIAGAQAAMAANQGGIDLAAQAGDARLAAQQASAQHLAQTRAQDVAATNLSASQDLDQALFTAMAALQRDEAAQRAALEGQNHAAAQDAAMANYQAQLGNYDLMNAHNASLAELPFAVQEAAGALGAFATPRRDSVRQELSGQGVYRDAPLRQQVLQTLERHDDPEAAFEEAENAAQAYAEVTGQRVDRAQLRRWVEGWFANDGQLQPDQLGVLGRLFGVQGL